MKNKLILIGAGGYAKSVIDSINNDEYTFCGFIDENVTKKNHLGYPVFGNSFDSIDNKNEYVYFISIGDNIQRKKWYDKLILENLRLINIIDKTSIVSINANIGIGCFVGKMAIVNSHSTIGNNCIINTKSLVEHGCTIDNHVNISTNVVVNGDVQIGEGTTIYSSSVIKGQTRIGSWSMTGAGTVVINDIPDNVLVVGVPGRIKKKINENM